ncbi:MAG TPA: nucleotidyltransferase family protein [Gemmatimonadaceae bacterium]|nr:nucleotidyltransferase family protein [Gemmatimonadaceae bacterium]
MTPTLAGGVDPQLDAASLYTLLRLALAEPLCAPVADWRALHDLAERERLLGIIWRRSAATIRSNAPREISAEWQRRAVLLGLNVERQLELLAACVAALTAAGVHAVVLKGAPLAQRLYGDFTVRPTLDVDLHIPAMERASAARVLGALGWRRTSGVAPEEENFHRTIGGQLFRLEVHSTALDDPLLHRIEFPVELAPVTVGGHTLPAQTGQYLPAYLAAHLVKHNEKPVLWALDFHALWSCLTEAEREGAVNAARSVGLARHLRWAIALTRDIDACHGTLKAARPALAHLMNALAPRGDAMRTLRLMSFAGSPVAALSVVAGRVWPVAWRQSWREAPEYFLRRAIRWTYRHLVFERPSATEDHLASRAVIKLNTEDAAPRLRDALRTSPAWIAPPDNGMEPAVPVFGMARIVAADGRAIREGDVVVACGDDGQCTLERVVSLGTDGLRIKADAYFKTERFVSHSQVLGICDLVDVGGRAVPISERPHGSLGLLRAIVTARVGTPVRERST